VNILFPPALLAVQSPELPLAMLIVFGSAKLGAELCQRAGMPPIVGEIIAGILIGPGALNLIRPSDTLETLAELGVMFLLFRVGLEVKASELRKLGGVAAAVAVAGIVVPFLLGWGALRAWGAGEIEAVFVGAAMVATSVGITAQVLKQRGLLQLRASRVILAAAILDDVLGLLVLAAVSGMAKGNLNLLDLGLTAAMAVAFVAAVVVYGARTMFYVVPRLENDLRLEDAEFHFSTLLLFGLALLSVYAGVAAIIGAFLAGMALGESVSRRVQDLVHGTTELLMPFFLVGIGLAVEVRQFSDPKMLALGGMVLVLAVVSKLGGCGVAALGLGRKAAYQVGAGMVPRGEIGMVAAQIGLGMGAISQGIYGSVVLMAVATTAVAPLLLGHAFRGETGPTSGKDRRAPESR
jgi:Kef-type K+ transport system membrane component KefB